MTAWRTVFILQCRALLRRRMLQLTVLGAALIAGLLPRWLTADGTNAGKFMLDIRYAFGGAAVMVMIATAVAAAGNLADERAANRLQLSLVRPCGRAAIFLGRFAALALAGALAIAAAAAAVGIRHCNHANCEHVLRPQLEDPRQLAERRLAQLLAEDQNGDFARKVAETGRDTVLWYLAKYEADELTVLTEGVTNRWIFPAAARFAPPYSVRLRVTDCFARLEDADCEFRFRGCSGRLGAMTAVEAAVPLAPDAAANGDGCELSVVNHSRRSLALSPRHDLQVRARADAFGWNLLRAAIALAAVNAAIAAIGLLLGSALGKSVAVFVMVVWLIVASLSPSAMEEAADPTESTRIDRLSLRICAVSAALAGPIVSIDAIDALCDDECVEPVPLMRRLAVSGLLTPAVCALLAAAIMRRKTADR